MKAATNRQANFGCVVARGAEELCFITCFKIEPIRHAFSPEILD